jgi:hypothetical protein
VPGGFFIIVYCLQHINSYLESLPRSTLTAFLAHSSVYLNRMRLRCKLSCVFLFTLFVVMRKRKCPRNLASAWGVRKARQHVQERPAALQTSPGVILTLSHNPKTKCRFMLLDRCCRRYRVFLFAHGSVLQLVYRAVHPCMASRGIASLGSHEISLGRNKTIRDSHARRPGSS